MAYQNGHIDFFLNANGLAEISQVQPVQEFSFTLLVVFSP
jgi:hypothetical protein